MPRAPRALSTFAPGSSAGSIAAWAIAPNEPAGRRFAAYAYAGRVSARTKSSSCRVVQHSYASQYCS
jgi:hypothetical protein